MRFFAYKSLGGNGRGLYQEIQLNAGNAWIGVFFMCDVRFGSYKAKRVFSTIAQDLKAHAVVSHMPLRKDERYIAVEISSLLTVNMRWGP